MLLEWFLTTRTAATTPRFSILTLSPLKIRAFFKWPPMFASLFLEDENRYRQTVFTIVNYIHGKAEVCNVSKIGRNWGIEKLLRTKSALQKLVNWVQLEIYSEWTTQQKRLGIVLNGRYSDGIMLLERWIFYSHSFWRTKGEMAKKRPKWPKIVKNRSFSPISQRITKRNRLLY